MVGHLYEYESLLMPKLLSESKEKSGFSSPVERLQDLIRGHSQTGVDQDQIQDVVDLNRETNNQLKSSVRINLTS